MTAGVVACLVVCGLSACGGGGNPLSGPDATPPPRRGVPTPVDVCALIPAETASQVLALQLQTVGRRVEPSSNATVVCQLGERFADPLVSVSFAPAPVARDVFDEAYGDKAGGNPAHVHHLGKAAYARTEGTHQVMHAYVKGAVLTVELDLSLPSSPDRTTLVQLIRLTRTAVRSLPDNPTIDASTAPAACDAVNPNVLAATLGRPPTLDAGLAYADESLMCSWGGQPGSVTLSTTSDPATIDQFNADHPQTNSIPVTGVIAHSEGRALSDPDVTGDLVIYVGSDRLLTLEVIPAAGYADTHIDTTDAERAVARAVLDQLADPN